ncbi:hypothetical protein FGE12_26730 [Aggregicoccus sp. 17bor-14]|uniref:hypothetical protein n=1 Tax=Myxococcaceae TaxID=31 RepID=UPI00129C80B4|nr:MULTISPECIES: hypothetical protein [Myxococcaceae]MBF5046038.1 hypothetical protein [Simulacricoccus sp. 17bor-14]MRI91768.1 hypothetical protein [Aggregicoccus sp. 17bor-14]
MVLLFAVSSEFSATGVDEYLSYGDGTSLPWGYILQPTTTEGRIAAGHLIFATSILRELAGTAVLALLVGLLWARTLRRAPLLVGALSLVPVVALVLCVTAVCIAIASPEFDGKPPLAVELGWEAEFWSKYLTKDSLWLVLLGFVALCVQALLRARQARPAPGERGRTHPR